jgi:hypothetical protein
LPFVSRATSALLLAALCLPGCRRRNSDEEDTTSGAEEVEETVAPRNLAGVMWIDPEQETRVHVLDEAEALCVRGSNELCNAIDEDCDGRIDEAGCPYRAGEVHVVMTWNTGADIDLYVREPDGDVLSHQRGSSRRGGLFDYAGRGVCEDTLEYPRIENVSWTRELAPTGEYEVLLHRWGDCLDRGVDANDIVQVLISISVGGQRLGSYRIELGPQERFEGLRFQVSEP